MWDDLQTIEPHFHYRGERTRYIAFPLGGLGTGGFSISGSGRLIDWSIRNRPALQSYNAYSHFLEVVRSEVATPRVIELDLSDPAFIRSPDRIDAFLTDVRRMLDDADLGRKPT